TGALVGVCVCQGAFDLAKDVFTQVQEVGAASETLNFPDVWVNLAHVFLAQEQYNSAIKMYQNCLKKFFYNCDAQVLLYMSRAYYDWGHLQDCKKTILRALHLNPTDHRLRFDAALAMQEFAVRTLQTKKWPSSQKRYEDVQSAVDELRLALRFFRGLQNITSGSASLGFDAKKTDKDCVWHAGSPLPRRTAWHAAHALRRTACGTRPARLPATHCVWHAGPRFLRRTACGNAAWAASAQTMADRNRGSGRTHCVWHAGPSRSSCDALGVWHAGPAAFPATHCVWHAGPPPLLYEACTLPPSPAESTGHNRQAEVLADSYIHNILIATQSGLFGLSACGMSVCLPLCQVEQGLSDPKHEASKQVPSRFPMGIVRSSETLPPPATKQHTPVHHPLQLEEWVGGKKKGRTEMERCS
ncbi:hypothetical protein CYMTET_20189, partial [Cymbomonas tetramitiformis]